MKVGTLKSDVLACSPFRRCAIPHQAVNGSCAVSTERRTPLQFVALRRSDVDFALVNMH